MQHPSNNVITIKRNKSHENSCHHRCRPGGAHRRLRSQKAERKRAARHSAGRKRRNRRHFPHGSPQRMPHRPGRPPLLLQERAGQRALAGDHADAGSAVDGRPRALARRSAFRRRPRPGAGRPGDALASPRFAHLLSAKVFRLSDFGQTADVHQHGFCAHDEIRFRLSGGADAQAARHLAGKFLHQPVRPPAL